MFLHSADMHVTIPSGLIYKQCMDIVKHLGYLPLAINQAASFIKQSQLGLEGFLIILNSADKLKVSRLFASSIVNQNTLLRSLHYFERS